MVGEVATRGAAARVDGVWVELEEDAADVEEDAADVARPSVGGTAALFA